MSLVVRRLGRHAALITGVVASSPPTTIDREPLLQTMRGLAGGVDRVVLAVDEPGHGTVDRLLSHARAVATAVRSVDALKLVAETVVVQMLDRDRILAAGLPAVVERSRGEAALTAAGSVVSVADIVAPGADEILLVDHDGNPII